jgi:predicted negative regulator of RcsB-dependent stress response
METPQVEETRSFWKTNKELIISASIILLIMLCLKYILKIALEAHTV